MSIERSSHTLTEYGEGGILPEMMWQVDYGQGDLRASWEAVSSYGLVPRAGIPAQTNPSPDQFGSEAPGETLPPANVTVVGLSEFAQSLPAVIGMPPTEVQYPIVYSYANGRIDILATFPIGRKDKPRDRLEFLKARYPSQQRQLYSRLRQQNGFAFVMNHLMAQTVGVGAADAYKKYLDRYKPSGVAFGAEDLDELSLRYGQIIANALHLVVCDDPHLAEAA